MSKIQLTAEQKKQLKAAAHALNPVVIISENGLSANVIKEIDNNLKAHELIKIRVFGDDKNLRQQYLEEICQKLNLDFCNYTIDIIDNKIVSKCEDFINENQEIITAYDIFKQPVDTHTCFCGNKYLWRI